MENASKALIIAGAILISVLIVSLGVMIFKNIGGTTQSVVSSSMTKQEISAFNSKIIPYLGESVSGSQVNELIQYVISADLAAIRAKETYKAIRINYPKGTGGTASIYVDVSGAEPKMAYDGSKRVDTSSGKFYKVEGTYNDGLITLIEVSNRP